MTLNPPAFFGIEKRGCFYKIRIKKIKRERREDGG